MAGQSLRLFRILFACFIIWASIASINNLRLLTLSPNVATSTEPTETKTKHRPSVSGGGPSPLPVVSQSLRDHAHIKNTTASKHVTGRKRKPKHERGQRDYACDEDFHIPSKMLLDHIKVAAPLAAANRPKILCFIMTHSQSHQTKVKNVLETWGKRCDKLVLASDAEDPTLGTIAMKSEATWQNLWNKLNETVLHIHDNYRDEFDWFLKADDDSYVIIENLHAFLTSSQVLEQAKNQQPLVYGRRFGMPMKNVPKRISDENFVHRFLQRYGSNQTLIFNSGGAGYVMNRPYLEQLIKGLTAPYPETAPHRGERCPEDVGQSITSLYHGNVHPQDSRDEFGRERFHFSHPNDMYVVPYQWAVGFHRYLGGISKGLECCSDQTITFHWMEKHPGYMQYVEKQLYQCRAPSI
jgi:hypothetical protein